MVTTHTFRRSLLNTLSLKNKVSMSSFLYHSSFTIFGHWLRGKYNSTSICSPVTNPEQNTFVSQTPGNIDLVKRIDNLVLQFCNQTLDILKLALFSKVIKGAKLAIANWIILNTTNAELY